MFLPKRAWMATGGVLVFAFTALFGTLEAHGQKNGGGGSTGPVPPGKIYFNNSGFSWSMKGDGSSKIQVPKGEPSNQLHGNSRWFLQNINAPETAGHFFAVNESGATVQLTNEPDMPWTGYPPSWGKDDSFFSYSCLYQTETEWIGRMFVVPLVWTGGVPVPGAGRMILEVRRSVFDEFGNWSTAGSDEATFGRHDWSPSGNEVAYSRWVWGSGWVIEIANFAPETAGTRTLATFSQSPKWSPDGSRIAFNRFKHSGYQEIVDVWTILPDGSNAKQLTAYVAGKGYNGTAQMLPDWSPDGAYLVFAERIISSSKTTYNICRIPSGGGGKVYLTTDGKSSYPRWRP